MTFTRIRNTVETDITVEKTATLEIYGTVNGDVDVFGRVTIDGTVNGTVTNRGDTVIINGQVRRVRTVSGKTLIHRNAVVDIP